VHTPAELRKALARVFTLDRIALVQKVVTGHDYRIVVLDNEVISAYERIPLSVVGDGVSSVAALLQKKQRMFEAAGRDTVIKVDDRMRGKLATQGKTMRSVLQKGEHIFLLDNANLSQGGDSVDVTQVLHDSVRDVAVRMTRDMGLRLCGVDIMLDGDVTAPLKDAKSWHVIEINAAPGLDHYATSGKAQEKIVEDLYVQVLKRMEFAE
jgi:D-alanine-D-alanine ligase-like ATP-grasp enzyme